MPQKRSESFSATHRESYIPLNIIKLGCVLKMCCTYTSTGTGFRLGISRQRERQMLPVRNLERMASLSSRDSLAWPAKWCQAMWFFRYFAVNQGSCAATETTWSCRCRISAPRPARFCAPPCSG